MLAMVKCFKMMYFDLQGFSNPGYARLSKCKCVYMHMCVVSFRRYLEISNIE